MPTGVYNRSESSKKHMSEAAKRRVPIRHTLEAKLKIGAAQRGKPKKYKPRPKPKNIPVLSPVMYQKVCSSMQLPIEMAKEFKVSLIQIAFALKSGTYDDYVKLAREMYEPPDAFNSSLDGKT